MLKLILGPCVIENKELTFSIAEKLKQITEKIDVDFYFKASFDKANRTSLSSYRGEGIYEGLQILGDIKQKLGLKIATDVHETWQIKNVAEIADIIQIPAFLCRQTDLLIEAGKTNKIINIKKGQFLAPWDMKNVVNKISNTGNRNIFLCERGTSFGYNNLVVDMTGIIEMKKNGYPVIFDATHSVQKPGGYGTSTGGNGEYTSYLAKAAIVTGVDGIFMETHPSPETALSDGPNMIKLDKIENLIHQILYLYENKENYEY